MRRGAVRACQTPRTVDPADEKNRLVAVLHEVNTLLMSHDLENVGREDDIDRAKRLARLAERIAAGNAEEGEVAAVGDLLHPGTRDAFSLRGNAG